MAWINGISTTEKKYGQLLSSKGFEILLKSLEQLD